MSTNNAINNNPANPVIVSQGGTSDTSFTAYSVICAGTTTTGALQNVSGVGTSGQVLVSQGAAALPQWATAPAGSMILLSTQTASSSASLSFSSTFIAGTYSSYFVKISGINNATGTVVFNMDWSTNNGSGYLGSGYLSGELSNAYNSATLANTNSTSTCPLTPSITNTSAVINGQLYINLPTSAVASYNGLCFLNDSTATAIRQAGINTGTTTINNIKFSYSSGNITSGTISLYGIAQ